MNQSDAVEDRYDREYNVSLCTDGDEPNGESNDRPDDVSSVHDDQYSPANTAIYERIPIEDPSTRRSTESHHNSKAEAPGSHSVLLVGDSAIKESSSGEADIPGKADEKTTIVENSDTSSDEEYRPQGIETLPDWRPRYLDLVVAISSLYVLVLVLLYTILYVVSKTGRRYIAAEGTYVDWVFRFGPVFLTVILAEILEQASVDLAAIEPYLRLSRPRTTFYQWWHERLTEPSTKGFVASVFRFFISLPCNGRLHFASVFCALVIVPLQSGLFDDGDRVRAITNTPFRVLAPETLLSAVSNSVFPQLALNVLSKSANVDNYEWIGEFERGRINEPLFAAMMPLAPEDSQYNSFDWTTNTSAVYSILNCTLAQEFVITASEISGHGADRSATNVHIEVSDEGGCSMSDDWPNLSANERPTLANPILADGTFALWRSVGSTNATSESGCSTNKYHVITGPLADASSTNFSADATPTSGWIALSCEASYYVEENSIHYGTNDVYESDFSSARRINESSFQSFKQPVDDNLLQNGLIYNMSFPNNAYFWGAAAAGTFGTDEYRNLTLINCAAKELPWGNDRACQMFSNIADMWSALAAITVISAAVLVAVDDWDIKPGTVTRVTEGWYLTGFSYGYTVFLFALLLFFLGCERNIRRNFFGLNWLGFGHLRLDAKSGLHCSPSSIAGVASVFQTPSFRRLFDGVDYMPEKDATRTIRNRLRRQNLKLRRWAKGTGDDEQVTPCVVRPLQSSPSEELKPHVQPGQLGNTQQQALRHGMLHPSFKLSPAVFLLTVVAIVLTFRYVVFGAHNSFQLWQEKESDDTFLRSLVQSILFSGLPTFAIAIAAMWWSFVDVHHRQLQPFVGLVKGDTARKTLLLSYVHDYHCLVSWKALRNHHWKLCYITFLTLAVRIATIFSAGIFVMSNGLSHNSERGNFSQIWRQETFRENNTDVFAGLVKDDTLTRAIFRSYYSNLTAPGTRTPGPGFYAVDVDSIHANFSCVPVLTTSQRQGDTSWSAVIEENECHGASWQNACSLPDSQTPQTTFPDGQCMLWKYLNQSDCADLDSSDVGRWWLWGLSGALDGTDDGYGQAFRDDAEVVSMLCVPHFYLDATSYLDYGGGGARELRYLHNSTPVPKDRWKGSESELNFTEWISRFINRTMAGELLVVTSTAFLDFTSVVTALNVDGVTISLFDTKRLSSAASSTFETIFASTAQHWQDDRASTLFLQPSNGTVPLEMYPRGEVAVFQKFPLYIGLGIMMIFCISIPLIYPWGARGRVWRTPRNVSYPANVVSMIYDSSIMTMVDRGSEPDGKYPELEGKRFKLGAFIGLSGKPRIGIEVEEKVDCDAP